MPSLTLIKGDRNFYLEFEVKDVDGEKVNIEGSSVRLKMQRYGSSSLTLDKEGEITNGSLGLCRVKIEEELVNIFGEFHSELEITWSSGRVLTAPSLYIKIIKDLPRSD